jgi:hypothetical protein
MDTLMTPVSVDLLRTLAASVPQPPASAPLLGRVTGDPFDVDTWIALHDLPVNRPLPWQGGRRWVFDVCPWNPDHRNRSAYIVQLPSGAVAAGCHHNGCAGRDWHALRDLTESDWHERQNGEKRAQGTRRRTTREADSTTKVGVAPAERTRQRGLTVEPPDLAAPTSTDPPHAEIVINGRFMRDISADAVTVLSVANQAREVPFVLRRGTALVRLIETTHGPMAEALQVASLRGIVDRVADFVTEKCDKDGEMRVTPARPPGDVLNDILTLADPPFPSLAEIISAPTFLPGGRLLITPGYDAESGFLLAPRGLDGVRVDLSVPEARHLLLDELLVDFPFADDASRAHAVAKHVQPFVRPLIDGPTPLYLIEAPKKGTGKGLLADVFSYVACGSLAPMMALSHAEDEIEKRITALLLSGTSIVVLDNVTAIRSSNIAVALRTTSWRGRVLGRSEMVTLPNTATWVATGNNPELSDEITRRVAPIRLDCGLEHPEDRAAFRHPLPEWAITHRAELVSACLSLVHAWLEAGSPHGSVTLGGFEAWAAVMGGLLDVAGVPGFLSNRDALRERGDRESAAWLAFCRAWWGSFGDRPATAGELLGVATQGRLLLDIWAGRSVLSAAQRFGHALAGRRDQVIGPYRIRYAGEDGRTHNASWRLERAEGRAQTPETTETILPLAVTTGVSGVPGVSAPPTAGCGVHQSDDGARATHDTGDSASSTPSIEHLPPALLDPPVDDWDEV